MTLKVVVNDELRAYVRELHDRVEKLADDEDRIGLDVRRDLWELRDDMRSLSYRISGCYDTDGCQFDDCKDGCGALAHARRVNSPFLEIKENWIEPLATQDG